MSDHPTDFVGSVEDAITASVQQRIPDAVVAVSGITSGATALAGGGLLLHALFVRRFFRLFFFGGFVFTRSLVVFGFCLPIGRFRGRRFSEEFGPHHGTSGACTHDEYSSDDDADEDGNGGDDAADCLRYLVATKSRMVTQRKLRGP